MNDRSNEALLARRAKAEAATPGPWNVDEMRYDNDVVFGIKNQKIEDDSGINDESNTGVPFEDNWTIVWPDISPDEHDSRAGVLREADAAHIAANSPDVTIADIDEILRLRAENAQLDREADWLADQMHKTLVIDGKHKSKCVFGKDEWREAARKATENPAQEAKQDAKQAPKWAWAKG